MLGCDVVEILRRVKDREESGRLNTDVSIGIMVNWHYLTTAGYVKKAPNSRGRYILTFLGHVALVKLEENE